MPFVTIPGRVDTTKIVALGAGAVGTAAARTLQGLAVPADLLIADRDGAAARRLAESLGVGSTHVDVTDESALRALLEPADLVINTVGPFYRFGTRVLKAAIDSRTHYVDICDDVEPTIEMLALDDSARAAGITAVIGMGASPGVSNLLAKAAAAGMDQLDTVYTVWPVDAHGDISDTASLVGANGAPSAAAVHWMCQISGTILVAHDSAIVGEEPLKPVRLTLPDGRRGTVYTVGHPEPVTLQRTLGAREAYTAMTLRRTTTAYLNVLRARIDRGDYTVEDAAARLAKPPLIDLVRAGLDARRYRGADELPEFFAVVTGRRAGVHVDTLALLPEEFVALLNDMAAATGVPLALATKQFIDGIDGLDRGVHAPETIVEQATFFADLAQHLGAEHRQWPVVTTNQTTVLA